MITKMFAVFDNKARAYGAPFFMPATGLAVRAFMELANDPKTTVHKYPSDFTLFQVGEFDDSKGMVCAIEPHINLGLASAFLNPLDAPGDQPNLADATAKMVADLKGRKAVS